MAEDPNDSNDSTPGSPNPYQPASDVGPTSLTTPEISPAGEAATLGEPPGEIFGHPTGLFTLFFAEMWERFSYYGMRALLVLYMIKGFLSFTDGRAYTVYGAYTALVYMTPFFGGLLADRVLGKRRCVIIGGILMSLGHLLMTYESEWPFYFALALLITGNGFFKPNISTMVGEMYPAASAKRDSGFTIFYMGINLGAAISPLLCGYVGETFGWHYGFGLATFGMMIGLAVFVMPNIVTQVLIGLAALSTSISLLYFRPDNFAAIGINVLVAAALLAAGVIAVMALGRGGLPKHIGQPAVRIPDFAWIKVLVGTAIAIPVFALLVSGFAPFNEGDSYQLFGEDVVQRITGTGEGAQAGPIGNVAAVLLSEVSKPAGLVLSVIGLLSFGYLIKETFSLPQLWRHRMIVALVLIFFQMLFFAFFEQAGSSISNFTDRNVNRVTSDTVVTADMVGTTIELQPTQAQLGYPWDRPDSVQVTSTDADTGDGTNVADDGMFTMSDLNDLRKLNSADDGNSDFVIEWPVSDAHVGMNISERVDVLAASSFQALNAIFILLLGLPFAYLWTKLGQQNRDPSAPIKFGLGLVQLGLGFLALYVGATAADDRGMVAMGWLALAYLLHTTGELCLSPVGLSQMTKLSPKYLVSTVMGGWFLATAFSQYLAAIISQFTGVSGEGGGDEKYIPPPSETVDVYGDVFYAVAIAAIVSGVVCAALSPWLKSWMHMDVDPEDPRLRLDSDA